MEMKKIDLYRIKPEEVDPNVISILALTKPLVRLKGENGLYRLWYRDLNGPNCICISPESSKGRSGIYWTTSYYRPDQYGKEFEITEIIH